MQRINSLFYNFADEKSELRLLKMHLLRKIFKN